MDVAAQIAGAQGVREPGGLPAPSRVASVVAVTAWGAGLIQIALGAGAVTGGSAASAAGFALMAIGAAGISGGAATLARGRIVVPRASVVGALLGIVSAFAAVALDPARISVIAAAAASVLWVVVALGSATALRTPRRSGAVSLTTLFVSAAVVAALVTPALSATEASLLAPHDGRPAIVVDEHRH